MESGLNQKDSNLVNAEIYINDHLLDVQIPCQNNVRFLEILNQQFNSKLDFIEIINLFGSANDAGCGKSDIQFINKSEISFVTLSDANTRRGLARENGKVYPFTNKVPLLVNIQTKSCNLVGNMHIKEGQSVQSVFNDGAQFMPLTNVSIVNGTGMRKLKACVFINKQHILSFGKASQMKEMAENIMQRHIDHKLVPEPTTIRAKVKMSA